MVLRSSIPASASAIGLGARFRYWEGRSGRRYLFTRIAPSDAVAFEGAVLLCEREGHVVFIGGVERADAPCAGGDLFVHLLAESDQARIAVIDDLDGPARTLHA